MRPGRSSPGGSASSPASAAAAWARSTAPTTSSWDRPVALKFLARDLEADPQARGAVPLRGAPLARGHPPQRLPRLRHRRGGGPPLPVHGASWTARTWAPCSAHRPAAGREGGPGQPADLRRPGRGPRQGRAAPRPQAGQRDARRPGPRAHHRLRAGPAGRRGRRRGGRHAGLHGAGAVRGQAGHACRATSTRWAWCCTRSSPAGGPSRGRRSPSCASKQAESMPSLPSTLVPDLDPAVERVIARCLEKDPALRPASVAQVAAALPGGDPLAAALAAGETPVARAGGRGGGGRHAAAVAGPDAGGGDRRGPGGFGAPLAAGEHVRPGPAGDGTRGADQPVPGDRPAARLPETRRSGVLVPDGAGFHRISPEIGTLDRSAAHPARLAARHGGPSLPGGAALFLPLLFLLAGQRQPAPPLGSGHGGCLRSTAGGA